MNYFDLKAISRQIEVQTLKVAEIREKGCKTTRHLGNVPGGGGVSDPVSNSVCNLNAEEMELRKLENNLKTAIESIPNDYIRGMIKQKICYGWSWTKIAMVKGKNNTGDSVRMMCTRYKW